MSGSLRSMVQRHVSALEDAAKSMEADGVGLHSTRGHVPILRRMAESMRVDAAVGKTPHQFSDSFGMYASSAASALPFAVASALATCGIDLGASDHIALADLNVSMDAADVSPGDRILVKQTLAKAGKLIA
jgi:hypothetical protein